MSWDWVARILWGVFWRWILVAVLVTIVLVIFSAIGKLTSGQAFSSEIMGLVVFGLWIAALFWSVALTLRARHGGYRLMPVSAEDSAKAFD